jgi:hypothetical protein
MQRIGQGMNYLEQDKHLSRQLRQEWHERLRDTLMGALVAVVPWVGAVVVHWALWGG